MAALVAFFLAPDCSAVSKDFVSESV